MTQICICNEILFFFHEIVKHTKKYTAKELHCLWHECQQFSFFLLNLDSKKANIEFISFTRHAVNTKIKKYDYTWM